MTRNVRTYGHFCLVARALERVGDRWSLLVVRDLLTGPKRFTDLATRLAGITPKTLTQRLRELQETGLVVADRRPGRREVWYELTPAGDELRSVVDALGWWSLRNAWRPPTPDVALHPEHMLQALVLALERTASDRKPTTWHLDLHDGGLYRVGCDGTHWTLTAVTGGRAAAGQQQAGRPEPDVTATATRDQWRQFVTDPSLAAADELGIDLVGRLPARRRFVRLVRALLETAYRSPTAS